MYEYFVICNGQKKVIFIEKKRKIIIGGQRFYHGALLKDYPVFVFTAYVFLILFIQPKLKKIK